MSRRRSETYNPINRRQKALDDQTESLRAELEKVRRFQEKAPEMKAEARRREQQEILSTYRRPVRLEGPSDFRYDNVTAAQATARPRKLRKERSKAPILTLVLLVTFCCVIVYAVRTLWHG